jgi:hypothetical protein
MMQKIQQDANKKNTEQAKLDDAKRNVGLKAIAIQEQAEKKRTRSTRRPSKKTVTGR